KLRRAARRGWPGHRPDPLGRPQGHGDDRRGRPRLQRRHRRLRHRPADARGDPGLSAHIAGPAASAADQVKIFKGIDSTLLYATLAVVIILLLLTYRSPVLWLLPVVSAGVALVSAEALIYLLAAHAGLTVNAQSAGILYVLVFGAGTDYA